MSRRSTLLYPASDEWSLFWLGHQASHVLINVGVSSRNLSRQVPVFNNVLTRVLTSMAFPGSPCHLASSFMSPAARSRSQRHAFTNHPPDLHRWKTEACHSCKSKERPRVVTGLEHKIIKAVCRTYIASLNAWDLQILVLFSRFEVS